MNSIYLIFLLIYAAPFGIALAMPGWRTLAGLGVTLGLMLIWLFISGLTGGGNGFAVALGLSFVMFAGVGLVSGVVTRGALLALPLPRKTAVVTASIVVVGFIFLPSMFLAINQWQKWQRRPPSEVCLASKHPVSIAGAIYYLPSAPVFTVWERMGTLFTFQSNEGLRTVCEQFNDSGEPIHVINLNLDLGKIRFAGFPMHGAYCQAPKSRWGQDLCNSNAKSADAAYPINANIYSPTEFDHRRMLASYPYAKFVEESEKAKAINHPFESEPIGIFDRYANRYWVARTGTWVNEAGEPFTLHCYDSTPAGTLGCSTTYRLKTGAQVTYQFHAPVASLEAAAKRVDENFRSMLAELSVP